MIERVLEFLDSVCGYITSEPGQNDIRQEIRRKHHEREHRYAKQKVSRMGRINVIAKSWQESRMTSNSHLVTTRNIWFE